MQAPEQFQHARNLVSALSGVRHSAALHPSVLPGVPQSDPSGQDLAGAGEGQLHGGPERWNSGENVAVGVQVIVHESLPFGAYSDWLLRNIIVAKLAQRGLVSRSWSQCCWRTEGGVNHVTLGRASNTIATGATEIE